MWDSVHLRQLDRVARRQRHTDDDVRSGRDPSAHRGEMMRMLDLFSGLGGASAAFVDNGWEVWRGDFNRLFFDPKSEYYVPHTVRWDAYNDDVPSGAIDFLWASPPCYEFSMAYNSPRSIAIREGRPFEPDMTLIERTAEIIETVKPKYWAVENVMGASKFIEPILGKHRLLLDSAMIWGNFPIVGFTEMEKGRKKRVGDKARYSPIRANIRAKMPYWLSDQMRKSVQYQMMISDFEDSLGDVSWAYNDE